MLLASLALIPLGLSLPDAAVKSAALLVRRPCSVVSFTGNDRHRLLHGLSTADVESLRKQRGALETAVVDAAGNVQGLLTVMDDGGDELLALAEPDRGEASRAFFDKYIFPADAVEVADASDAHASCCLELAGPLAAEVLGAAVAGGQAALPSAGGAVRLGIGDDADALIVGIGSLGYAAPAVEAQALASEAADGATADGSASCFSVLLADDAAADLCYTALAAGVERVGGHLASSWEALRIRRGRPTHGLEYASSHAPKASPFSLGLWHLVTPEKGCFLGNEVLVRLARAKRQKLELYGVRLDGSGETTVGTEVFVDEEASTKAEAEGGTDLLGASRRSVGVLTSVLEGDEEGESSFALALVRPPAADVGVRVLVGGVAGELVDLPFATRGRVGAADSEGEDDDAAAKAAAAKAAEAERKAAKLKAMQEKMKALGLA